MGVKLSKNQMLRLYERFTRGWKPFIYTVRHPPHDVETCNDWCSFIWALLRRAAVCDSSMSGANRLYSTWQADESRANALWGGSWRTHARTHAHARSAECSDVYIIHSSRVKTECALPQGSIQRQAGEIKEIQVLWRHQLAEVVTAETERKSAGQTWLRICTEA